MKSEKIGVYVCKCGPNIRDAMNLSEVAAHAAGLKGVARVQLCDLLCSAEGRQFVENDIRESRLDRVVFAGCSPKEHERTFRNVMLKAGLNPFLMQVANIREQCAWVTKDRSRATRQAAAIVTAAVERVRLHEPLQPIEITCRPDVLVIGAGVAGIGAALSLAQEGRRVYLVERLPVIGGRVALYEGLFPDMACASCVIESELDAVLHSDRIETITQGRVVEARGYFGNFVVSIARKARFVDEAACIGCGACLDACPVETENEFNRAMDTRKAIYIPYPGALPNLALIDRESCLRFQGKACSACRDACPFGAVDYEARDDIRELRVGAVVIANGFDTFNPWGADRQAGDGSDNILSGTAFERLVNSAGPTGGSLVLKDGTAPGSIAIVHCVGSRTRRFNAYCSGVCCRSGLKHARQARELLPHAEIFEFYADMCLPGRDAQLFFDSVSQNDGIRFVRMAEPGAVKITRRSGRLAIACTDTRGKLRRVYPDMVILESAMQGAAGSGEIADIFDIPMGRDGFFESSAAVPSPVESGRNGIFVAGCAQGPRDIRASIAQGQAAAGRILNQLVPGKRLALEPIAARIDDMICCGCLTCKSTCAYKAISCEEDGGPVFVNQAMCRGCGVCAAACPSGAIEAGHYTDTFIKKEIEGLLNSGL